MDALNTPVDPLIFFLMTKDQPADVIFFIFGCDGLLLMF